MEKKKKTSFLRETIEWLIYILAAFLIASLINSEVYALAQVNQCSMQNTLFAGEELFVDKVTYHFKEPKFGDIIVFLKEETVVNFKERYINVLEDIKMKLHGEFRSNRLIKRVIGVPGDIVDIKDGKVYINGSILDEPYVKGITYQRILEFPVTIPEGKILVLGDNRENSVDSRAFGLVDYNSVEGRAIYRIWPVKKIGKP